ncbi:hypothetical protein BCR39DRAFT_574875 [Naematelia encephala]|uniref:FCP1 homology domain-containing protein n=1 Tax=Naematelia encephala TaxID=71784 RepID=A0A1Y2B3Y9_9TREE|nr:hypothetical protein BCR39DRAFT_574875 [Naematelia encephala]
MTSGTGDNLPFPTPEAYQAWLNAGQPPIPTHQPVPVQAWSARPNFQPPFPPPAFASTSSYGYGKDQRAYHTAQSPPWQRPAKTPNVFLPSKEYLELSKPVPKVNLLPDNDNGEASTSATVQPLFVPKLLVLDLNGALVYRAKGSSAGRKAHPRPYLGCFLEYVFTPEPDFMYSNDRDSPPRRPWEVFVWSSAQPKNVRGMVEACFGMKWCQGIWNPESEEERRSRERIGEGRLLGVWSRDKMGLNAIDYHNKVQTVKDLQKVHYHLGHPNDPAEPVDRPPYEFDERTTFLIDDSPLKGVHQPWNQLVIPQYDKPEYTASQMAALALSKDPQASDVGMDKILLGVIGILEVTRSIDNIPAWVRGGGLDFESNDGVSNGAEPLNLDKDPTIDSLPSHESFSHWYQTPRILAQWIEQGEKALQRKGIELRHGLDPNSQLARDGTPPRVFAPRYTGSSEIASSPSEFELKAGQRSEVPVRKEKPLVYRRYSPSRPASAEPEEYTPPAKSSELPRRPVDSSVPSAGPSRRNYSTVPTDSWRPSTDEAWRTFRAFDVSLYLNDLADRPSLLDQQQRHRLLEAAAILTILGPSPEDDQRASGAELLELGFSRNLCDKCTMEVGITEAERRNSFVRRKAAEAGMGDGRKSKAKTPKRAKPKGTAATKGAKKTTPAKIGKVAKKKAMTTRASRMKNTNVNAAIATGTNNVPVAGRVPGAGDTDHGRESPQVKIEVKLEPIESSNGHSHHQIIAVPTTTGGSQGTAKRLRDPALYITGDPVDGSGRRHKRRQNVKDERT